MIVTSRKFGETFSSRVFLYTNQYICYSCMQNSKLASFKKLTDKAYGGVDISVLEENQTGIKLGISEAHDVAGSPAVDRIGLGCKPSEPTQIFWPFYRPSTYVFVSVSQQTSTQLERF
jgi:hypothetical protein